MTAAQPLDEGAGGTPRRLRIFRSRPGQAEPSYQEFTASCGPRTTVVEALRQIRVHQDPSLMIRHSCLHGSCGTCGVRVNGREVLGCLTLLSEVPGEAITIEPLRNAPLVGDLVVDPGPTHRRLAALDLPPVRPREGPGRAAPGITELTQLQDCLECGLCTSACLVSATDPDYAGPAALWAAARVLDQDGGGPEPGGLDWVADENGCWRCHVAEECTAVCPAGADPAAAIMALRRRFVGNALRRLVPGRRGG